MENLIQALSLIENLNINLFDNNISGEFSIESNTDVFLIEFTEFVTGNTIKLFNSDEPFDDKIYDLYQKDKISYNQAVKFQMFSNFRKFIKTFSDLELIEESNENG